MFVAGMVGLHLLLVVNLWGRISRGYPDFTVFYTAAKVLRGGLGHRLYDPQVQYQAQKSFAGEIPSRRGPLPYIHPPFEALIFMPLTQLPYRHAFAAWDLLNIGALFGVAWLLRRSVRMLGAIPVWEFVLGCLAFFPVFACLLQGQDSILLLLLCTLGFNALKREENFLAGCWFALGIFKFQLIVPIVLLLILSTRRRVAMGFAAVSMLLALVSVGLVGWEGALHYPEYVLQVVKTPSLGGIPLELMPNLNGLVQGWPFLFPKVVWSAVALVSSVILFLFAAWAGRTTAQPEKLELQFALAVVVSGLIGWQTNAHDLSLLVLPLVLILDYCVQMPTRSRRFALLLPVLPVLLSPLWIVLWLAAGRVNLMAIPLLWWAWEIGREISGAGRSRWRSTAQAAIPG